MRATDVNQPAAAHIRELCLFNDTTPSSASLHPGLYAAARIRELRMRAASFSTFAASPRFAILAPYDLE